MRIINCELQLEEYKSLLKSNRIPWKYRKEITTDMLPAKIKAIMPTFIGALIGLKVARIIMLKLNE